MRKVIPVLLFILLASAHASAKGRGAGCESEMCGLVIRGEVTGLEVERPAGYVVFNVKLNVEFVNEGTEPIILFAPTFGKTLGADSSGYWLGGFTLYSNEEEVKSGRPIFVDGRWQSVTGGDTYRALSEKLDARTPPDEYTRTLRPGESWKSTDEFVISFDAEKHTRNPERRTWKEMREFPRRLWLRIDYEISPWNVEYFKPDLIRKLKKRWATFGNVLVEKKKESGFNLFRAESEPMRIDFSQAKETASKSGQE
jgi:hypothetical protein